MKSEIHEEVLSWQRELSPLEPRLTQMRITLGASLQENHMNRLDFYKELHYKEEEKKSEINNSLSLPISIISAIIAANLYLITNFDYSHNIGNSVFFILVSAVSLFFLGKSVFHIIKSYTNLHKGYDYVYLADCLALDDYHKKLKDYYLNNSNLIDTSEEEFEEFIISELVKNTDQNQKNNKLKSKHRYLGQNHLITALIIVSLSVIPFSVNYCFKKKNENIPVEIHLPKNNKLNSNNDKILFDTLIIKFKKMNNDRNPPPPPKPTPPPSQIIKEGQNPVPRPSSPPPPTPRQQ